MKKVYSTKRIFSFLFVCVYLFLFNISCGLDTFYVIEPPINTETKPMYDDDDYPNKTFIFFTRENNNIEGFDFTGTSIYYKIYDNSSKMIIEREALLRVANDDNTSANAPLLMIDNYKYKKLKIAGRSSDPIIPSNASVSSQKVELRLSDYQNTDFASKFIIDGTPIGTPVRNVMGGKQLTFNFGRNGEFDKKPAVDDIDCLIEDSSSTNFYVCLFAVGVGKDSAYTSYYSNILYLGDVKIDSTSFDN